VRFVDLLRTTVLLSAGAATTLAVICIAGATNDSDSGLVFVAAAWWFIAAVIGIGLGRKAETSPPIARLLAEARAATMMPEHQPGTILINRLWPLVLSTVVAGGLAFIAPQIPGIAAGFTIIWSLAWRRQDGAVAAIEERDGVTFFVEKTSPITPVKLVRAPGFRRERPVLNGETP
jgi:hypothetical protein